jgi:uncharacterized protein YkwD
MIPDEIERQRSLITAHKERLYQLELQQAKLGLDCPPQITNEIVAIRNQIQNLEKNIELKSMSLPSIRSANTLIGSQLSGVENAISGIKLREERVFKLFGREIFAFVLTRTILPVLFAVILAGAFVGILTGIIKLPPNFIQNLPTATATAQPTEIGTPSPTPQEAISPTQDTTSVVEQPTILVPVLPTPTLTPTLTFTPTPTPTLTLTFTPTPTQTPRPTDTPIPTFPPPPAVDEDRERQVIILMNQYRHENGCDVQLQYSSELTGAARRHSVDMATHNFFDHTGSDKSEPGDRITQAGYRWAFGVPEAKGWEETIYTYLESADQVVSGWMQSDSREPILNCNYHDVGVGYARSQEGTSYWTAVFTRGRR